MQVEVYDTYARTGDGRLLHFDVLLPRGSGHEARNHALDWLERLGIDTAAVSLSRCDFCQSQIADPSIRSHLETDGYFVLPIDEQPDPHA